MMLGGLVLTLWLLWVVLRDLFTRSDISAGRGGCTVLACVLPIVGSVIYLVSRGPEAEDTDPGHPLEARHRGDVSVTRTLRGLSGPAT